MNYLENAFSHTLEQLLVLVLPTIVVAMVMDVVARHNWKYGDRLIGRSAFAVFTALGTMIHELSHALACIVFHHKITEMELFKPDPSDNSLGYVSHSYDRNSFYQRMGNLPIGVAPIIGGSLALGLLLLILGQGDALKGVFREPNPSHGPIATLAQSLDVAWDAVVLMVKKNRVLSLKTVLFLYLVFCIGTNISLSRADIRGALPAVPFALGLLLAINVLFSWVPGYANGVAWGVAVGAACLGLLVLVLAVNAILLSMLYGIAKLMGRE